MSAGLRKCPGCGGWFPRSMFGTGVRLRRLCDGCLELHTYWCAGPTAKRLDRALALMGRAVTRHDGPCPTCEALRAERDRLVAALERQDAPALAEAMREQDRLTRERAAAETCWTAAFHRKNTIIMALARRVATLKALLWSRDKQIAALEALVADLNAVIQTMREQRARDAREHAARIEALQQGLSAPVDTSPAGVPGEFEPIGDACFTSFPHEESLP